MAFKALEVLPSGLLLQDGRILGDILTFPEHGAYTPDGKVEGDLDRETIDRHNRARAELVWKHLSESGRGILYLKKIVEGMSTRYEVSDWTGVKKLPCFVQCSFHNFAGKDGRRDVWFTYEGFQWHGVNIGWSDIVHVKKTKTGRRG